MFCESKLSMLSAQRLAPSRTTLATSRIPLAAVCRIKAGGGTVLWRRVRKAQGMAAGSERRGNSVTVTTEGAYFGYVVAGVKLRRKI
jgi:hypothetical protein